VEEKLNVKTRNPVSQTKSKNPRGSVGVVGLGIMGSAMAVNLHRAGYRVVGFDVLAARRRELRRAGGEDVPNCRDVGSRTKTIVCSLPSPEALLKTAAELGESQPSPQIVVDTSTLPIAVKEEARRILAGRAVTLLDCPVSGTGPQARSKDLVVYASGDRVAYRRVVQVIDGFARAQYYVGLFGAGSKVKFVANLMVAIHNVAAAEGLVLAMKAGLDPAMVFKVIADGAGSSRMFQVRGPLMVKGNYSDAMMKLGIWQKDMTIITDFARQLNCPTPLFAATAPLYSAAMAMGRDTDDTGAICAVLEEMAGNPRQGPKRAKSLRGSRR
jgi:3-hydroxyisobutyrate dehydrogenase-like beta-hydroxyacid dehydrogenase